MGCGGLAELGFPALETGVAPTPQALPEPEGAGLAVEMQRDYRGSFAPTGITGPP